MARKMVARQSRHDEVTSGEILVGLAWIVVYISLVASGWARDALTRVAERSLPGLF